MLEIIGAAVLVAFGILAIYFSLEGGTNDKNLTIILLIGIAALVAGGWIILTKITLFIILKKLAGLIMAGIGVFLIIGFPDIKDYQPEGMTVTGMFIGLILIIIGCWFLFF
jgi:hypothetical protein